MVDAMKPFAASMTFDGLGSIIATQGTTGPRIMVDAHMDELGGMVRRVTPRGLLTMQMLGGWLDQALVDQRWIIIGSKGPVHAVTGIRDVHVVPADERTRVYSRDSLFLDVGATTEAEVARWASRPAIRSCPTRRSRCSTAPTITSRKGWDDRVGCGVIIEAMRRLADAAAPEPDLWTITTQEEIGLRGAKAAADVVKPELAIAIEGGITGDVFPAASRGDAGEARRRAGDLPSTIRRRCPIAS